MLIFWNLTLRVKSYRYDSYNQLLMGYYDNSTIATLANGIVCNHESCSDNSTATSTRSQERRLNSSAAHAITWHSYKSFIDFVYSKANVVIQKSPRSVCQGDCCISRNRVISSTTFADIGWYSEQCYNFVLRKCDLAVSVYGANIKGTVADVCNSNRPNGCT
ncbi:hypothetical protein V1506DRAFT_545696 [Lipomyces tetrasporus]